MLKYRSLWKHPECRANNNILSIFETRGKKENVNRKCKKEDSETKGKMICLPKPRFLSSSGWNSQSFHLGAELGLLCICWTELLRLSTLKWMERSGVPQNRTAPAPHAASWSGWNWSSLLADLSSYPLSLFCFVLNFKHSACLQVEDETRPGRQCGVMEQAQLGSQVFSHLNSVPSDHCPSMRVNLFNASGFYL